MTTFSWLYRLNQVMTTVIFRQPPPGSWQGGIRTHEPIGTDLQSACFDHLHTCQELPSRWQLPGVLPPITVSLPKKTGLNFTFADKLNIKRSTYCSMPNCNRDGRYRTCDTLDISQLLYHWAMFRDVLIWAPPETRTGDSSYLICGRYVWEKKTERLGYFQFVHDIL